MRWFGNEPKASEPPQGQVVREPPPPEPDDERYARLAREAAAAAAAETADEEAQKKREIAEAQAKLDRARKVLQDSGLWIGTCAVYNEMNNWPGWIERNGWVPPIPLESLAGREEQEAMRHQTLRHKWVAWKAGSHNYELRLQDRGRGFEGDHLATLHFKLGENTVLSLDVGQDDNGKWHASQVDRFVAGAWMIVLAELAARLDAKRRERMDDVYRNYVLPKADRVDLSTCPF